MIRVGCGSRRDHTRQVARLDRVDRCAAHADLSIFYQAAGAHSAHLAAHANRADVTGSHFVGPLESRAQAKLIGADQHLLGSRVRALLFVGSG
jgi:hypothetical protein